MDFGKGLKLLRDAVYCKGSTTVLEPAKRRERESVCIVKNRSN